MGQCRQSELPVEAEVYESLDKVRFFVVFFSFSTIAWFYRNLLNNVPLL